MKKIILIFSIIVISLNSIEATTIENASPVNTHEIVTMDCSGEFEIDGTSYTITLHDVSLWTCIKFKVASL